jgi:hypothetical protein
MLAERCTSLICTNFSNYCASGISNLDSSVNDFSGINFDGTTLLGTSNYCGTGSTITFGTPSSGVDRMLVPLGLPVMSTATTLDAILFGTSAGQISSTTTHSATFGISGWFNVTIEAPLAYTQKRFAAGFAMGISSGAQGAYRTTGFRCILDAE